MRTRVATICLVASALIVNPATSFAQVRRTRSRRSRTGAGARAAASGARILLQVPEVELQVPGGEPEVLPEVLVGLITFSISIRATTYATPALRPTM